MEAAGMVASIFGITSFALELSKTLYDFGDAVSSAKEETDDKANNISGYSDVLDFLQESLQNDEPLYTQKGLDLVEKLSKQSHALFERIQASIPGSPPWEGFKWREKMKWAFRRAEVRCLVGEIAHLKATLNLLLLVILRGRQTYVKSDKDQRYTRRARQALYEHFKASERLSALQNEAAEEEHAGSAEAASSSTFINIGTLMLYNDPVLSTLQRQYLDSTGTHKEKIARLQEDSLHLLGELEKEWFDAKNANNHLNWQISHPDPNAWRKQQEEQNADAKAKFEKELQELRLKLLESEKDLHEQRQELLKSETEFQYMRQKMYEDFENASEKQRKINDALKIAEEKARVEARQRDALRADLMARQRRGDADSEEVYRRYTEVQREYALHLDSCRR